MAFAALLTLVALSLSAHGDMFKCKDGAGKITYQQTLCQVKTVGKSKADTSVGDPGVIGKKKAESGQFNLRHTVRREMQAQIAEKQNKELLDLRKVRAQEDQPRASEDQADA